MAGVGAEIAAIVSEKAFGSLKAPVKRVTGPDAPPPASFPLEQAFVPQTDRVIEAVRSAMSTT
jgi:pyruvate dehydrogenase E1 component beta subunit